MVTMLSPMTSTPSRGELRILIAPSGFKESLGPEQVADVIEEGIHRVLPRKAVYIRKAPLHDGGEGFCRGLVAANAGTIRNVTVTGPVGLPVQSHLGFIGRHTAVLDMAAAAGLRLVPADCRDPTVTTTYGVGELIKSALDEGVTKIIVGCGDSGTSDGGAGALQALGARFIDDNGDEVAVARGGGSLSALASIDLRGLHPRLREGKVQIEAVCNIKNVLTGPNGVARVYGPQKGATPAQVELLSAALDRFADASQRAMSRTIPSIATAPGSGASGGLGAALLLLGARLRDRSDALSEYFPGSNMAALLDHHPSSSSPSSPSSSSSCAPSWDLVITGEGMLDRNSGSGKMTTEIAARARLRGIPVVVLAGTIGEGAAELAHACGVTACMSVLDRPMALREAIAGTEGLLRDAAERMLRTVVLGMGVALRRGGGQQHHQVQKGPVDEGMMVMGSPTSSMGMGLPCPPVVGKQQLVLRIGQKGDETL